MLSNSARYWIDNVVATSPVAATLGIAIAEAEPDRVLVALPFRPRNVTVGSIVHGGVIATLIDIAGAAASGSALGDGEATVIWAVAPPTDATSSPRRTSSSAARARPCLMSSCGITRVGWSPRAW